MNNSQQGSTLTPIPSPPVAGEGSVVTELVHDQFRRTR
jgi:hypothetical protein